MKNKKRISIIISIITLCCAIMAIVDGIIQPHYAIKSAVKLVLFLAFPYIYSLTDKEIHLKSLFRANRKGIKTAFLLCVPVYIVIVGGYFLLKDLFDFSDVTKSLTGNIGVNSNNFVFVAIYISFINSLLEEFFFRGFGFLTLKKFMSRKKAYIFSAVVFALYHIAIMTGWFSISVFIITMVGLFIGGLIFNYLDEKSNNIYTSWFLHMFANFAINTIGFILFEII